VLAYAGPNVGEVAEDESVMSLLQHSARPIHKIGDVALVDVPPADSDLLELISSFRPCASCAQEVRVGGENNGGYPMCKELLSGVSGAYSYGIKGSDRWGGAISTQFGIKIHQFDCFNRHTPPCKEEGNNCLFEFNEECVGGRSEEIPAFVYNGHVCSSKTSHAEEEGNSTCSSIGTPTTLRFGTLKDQMTARDHAKPRVVGGDLLLKMDIEGSEWDVLADPSNQPFLQQFSQIILEFHSIGGSETHDVRQQLVGMQNLLRDFVVVHVHGNNCCGEVHGLPSGYNIPRILEATLVHRAKIPVGQCEPNPAQTGPDNLPRAPPLPDMHLPGGADPW